MIFAIKLSNIVIYVITVYPCIHIYVQFIRQEVLDYVKHCDAIV
jgi:hypothetical protein